MHATGVRICLDAIWGYGRNSNVCRVRSRLAQSLHIRRGLAAALAERHDPARTGYHDNTPANKNVAEPRNWTGAGHRAIDNMMIGGVQGVHLSDEEFEAEIMKRRQHITWLRDNAWSGCLLCGTSKPPVKPRVAAATTGQEQQQ